MEGKFYTKQTKTIAKTNKKTTTLSTNRHTASYTCFCSYIRSREFFVR